MARKRNWEPGNYVEIPLPDDAHGYGVVTDKCHLAILDYCGSRKLQTEEVAALDILFELVVMKYGIGRNGWPIAGVVELTPKLRQERAFFKQDILTGKISIVDAHWENERAATAQDCVGLEKAAAWSPEHVESRLADHFAGRPNKWVESLSLR